MQYQLKYYSNPDSAVSYLNQAQTMTQRLQPNCENSTSAS